MKKDEVVLKIEGAESKLEEISDFRGSYFQNEYLQAFQIVNDIIEHSIQQKQKKRTQVQNILPFIGKRGTGKTSAMLSFRKALENYHRIPKNRNEEPFFTFRIDQEKTEVLFTCLESIDGSLLEQDEDIFKIILAQMYNQFIEMNSDKRNPAKEEDRLGIYAHGHQSESRYDYCKKELQMGFDKVYRSIVQFEHRNHREVEESPIMSLKNLSNSLQVRKDFENLIDSYLNLLQRISGNTECPYNINNQCHFLVVTIDDLDLNISNGYDMLEKLHRYLMIPNIIILISLDYDQMKLLCEKYFSGMIPHSEALITERYKCIEKLAQDFLDKVLPANMRIYMPPLTMLDTVQVKMGDDNQRRLKDAIFYNIMRGLSLRLDSEGMKRHFFEQSSLRTYVNFYLLLEKMEPLAFTKVDSFTASQKKQFWEQYQKNYRIIMSDICIRMVNERLTLSSKADFMRIVDMKLPRSLREIYSHIMQIKGYGTQQERARLSDLAEVTRYYGYSYGELLRIIYCWGRVNDEYKELVRCLMAFFSVELRHLYWQYRIWKREEQYYKAFLEIIDGSVTGSWGNKMFPKLKNGDFLYHIGMRKKVDMHTVFHAAFNWKDVKKEENGNFSIKEGKLDVDTWDGEMSDACLTELKKVFHSVIVLSMFFSQPYYKNETPFEWKMEEQSRTSESDKNRLADAEKQTLAAETRRPNYDIAVGVIEQEQRYVTFNMMNFVVNAFRWNELYMEKKDQEGKKSMLVNSLYAVLFTGTKSEEKREEILDKLGLAEEFAYWQNKSFGFALPLYDLDVCYNLIKRLRQSMYEDSMALQLIENENARHIINKLKQQYRFIMDCLERNDLYYQSLKYKESNLKDNFEGCPFIKWFVDSETELVEDFEKIFGEVIYNMLVGENGTGTPNSVAKEDTVEPGSVIVL